ncbi:MAG: glycoside hydrolase family 31 protein [Chitinophagales bacterium]|nr:glycoside hydrolase family 31 protein [Chitinophagales bacterium]MDW8427486.1 glycoside hydrolase family 31 protein [Chitinophagales bacterium]
MSNWLFQTLFGFYVYETQIVARSFFIMPHARLYRLTSPFLLAFTILSFDVAVASSVDDRPLGNLLALRQRSNGLDIKTDQGRLAIHIFSHTVFRIVAVWDEPFVEHSYAVVAKPQTIAWRWKKYADSVIITTDSIKLHLTSRPVRLTFYTRDNRLLLADDAALGIAWAGSTITAYKKLQPGERFIGLGEKTGNLDRRGSAFVHWNSDVPGYGLNQDPLYASIPFYMGFHDSLCYGIFLDNSSRSIFNFGASQNRFSSFSVEDGNLIYYFIHRSTPSGILEDYTWLTGRMPLPPKWALGYHQCRWSYYPEQQVLSLAETFRHRGFPCDAIWLDIHYMDAYKTFTWHPVHFPQPRRMLDSLQASGFHTVVILDPGIKKEQGYSIYEEGASQKLFLTYPDGEEYLGEVWPGWCVFPDFSNPQARQWWGDKLKPLADVGVDGWWCDMNEIATWGQSTPLNVRFHGDGNPFTYRTGKNLYGLLMVKATYTGALRTRPQFRPFVLTRAGFAGLQRYAAIWTGDNVADEQHMLLGVRLLNALGLSGVPFCGVDVGGFIGTASPALMARWMSIGALSPFFRGHKEINAPTSEPWAFNESTERIARSYALFRYRLMPYLYTSFYQAAQSGLPIQRSLALYYPFHPKVYEASFQHQYFLGDALMVAPCVASQLFTQVFLPEGQWYDLHTGQRIQGPAVPIIPSPVERLPIFVRGGSFLFIQKPVLHTGQSPGDTLQVHVFYGQSPHPQPYYEDAGDGFAYQAGVFWHRTFRLDTLNRTMVLDSVQGSFPSVFKHIKFYLHGFPPLSRVFYADFQTEPAEQEIKFVEVADPEVRLRAQTFEMPHTRQRVAIYWESKQ